MKKMSWRPRSVEYRFEDTYDPVFALCVYSKRVSQGSPHVSAPSKTKTKSGPKKNKKKSGTPSYRITRSIEYRFEGTYDPVFAVLECSKCVYEKVT